MMVQLERALFNWLQITVVATVRPQDVAAQETAQFFRKILRDDFQVEGLRYERDALQYTVQYQRAGEEWNETRFDQPSVESLIIAIQSEPRYNKQ